MRRSVRLSLLMFVLCGSGLSAQSPSEGLDVVHLTFDDVGAPGALNWARSDPFASTFFLPETAELKNYSNLPPSLVWAPGRFGSALRGMDPGQLNNAPLYWVEWPHHVTGDLTVAMFLKVRRPIPTNNYSSLLQPTLNGPGISLAVGSNDEITLGWSSTGSGTNGSFSFPFDEAAITAMGWVHVAFTIDRQAQLCTYYLNGAPQGLPLATPALSDMMGGTNPHEISAAQNASFDIDEVRIAERLVPPYEILRWATEEQADVTHFGESCAPFGVQPFLAVDLASYGRPVIGNAQFRLTAVGIPGSTVTMGWGFGRLYSPVYNVALPYDLGGVDPDLAGCLWYSSADFLQSAVCDGLGRADFLVPIPDQPFLVGFPFFGQCLLDHPLVPQTMVTNAVASRIGYGPAPAMIDAIAPTSGTAAGGTLVTITGSGFNPDATVLFGGIPATGVTVLDSETITCVTPTATMVGVVDVTVTDAEAPATLLGAYDYQAILDVTGIVPLIPQPGQTVTIAGFGFSAATTLSVDGVVVTPVAVSIGAMTFVTPAAATCDAPIVVTNPDGMSVTTSFNPAPVIGNLGSTNGPAAGGQVLVITGSNFAPGTTVTIGGTPATISTLTPGFMVVFTPAGTPGAATLLVTGPLGCTDSTTYTYN